MKKLMFILFMGLISFNSESIAGEIYTGILTGKDLSCKVVNVDKVPRKTSAALILTEGDTSQLVGLVGPNIAPPGGSMGAEFNAGLQLSRQGFCKFTVVGPKESIRGSICILNKNTCISSLEAH